MARSKRTPERSTLVRPTTPAFSRRQRPGGKGEDGASADPNETTQTEIEPITDGRVAAKADPNETTQTEIEPIPDGKVGEPRDAIETQPLEIRDGEAARVARAEAGTEGLPVVKPVDDGGEIARPAVTLSMPVQAFGGPPDMPRTSAPPPLVLGDVENPAHMPGPKDIPGGDPNDPAPAPGHVPPGDSRSLRRDRDFALVYRVGTCVITRTGSVGTRGQWRVVEYPTSGSASNSYAKECSRFVSEGFSDYRE